jgi:ferritin-like metal-binding protein YciE
MARADINEKFVEHLNELLSIENATLVHLQDRIRETPIEDVRKRYGSHLDETTGHQHRLQQVIRNLGGTPTESKGHLPGLIPSATALAAKTVKDTVREAIKSAKDIASGGTDIEVGKLTSEEIELLKTKNDMIIEDAEVISYKLLIRTAERLGIRDDVLAPLKQTLSEEEQMAQWLMDRAPSILDYHWTKIEASLRQSDAPSKSSADTA